MVTEADVVENFFGEPLKFVMKDGKGNKHDFYTRYHF